VRELVSIWVDPSARRQGIAVQLIEPGTLYDDRLNQMDLRGTRTFGRGKTRVKLMVDLYNSLKANPVLTRSIPLTTNDTYAPPPSISWGRPVGVLEPRLFKVGAQFDF